jgi:alkyl hydroperoxide reductase subunit D
LPLQTGNPEPPPWRPSSDLRPLALPSLDSLLAGLPDDAKDLRLNLRALLDDAATTPARRWGTALAVATALGARTSRRRSNRRLEAPASGTGPLADAKGAAAIMEMTNVYYRFRHLVGDPIYETLSPRLRMQRLAAAKADKLDMELFALAVSAANDCEFCVKAHDRKLRDHGIDVATRSTTRSASGLRRACDGSVHRVNLGGDGARRGHGARSENDDGRSSEDRNSAARA